MVDDTPENLVSLEAALYGLGEELVTAQSGKEALRHLLNNDFAAILLDVRMPEMDGFETAELIRSRPRSRQTPIIFLTGYKNEEHLFRGYDLGAVDFLFKPIVPEVLRSKVSVFVELGRSSAKLKEQTDALQKQTEVLRKAEQKFRILLEVAPDAMVMCRQDGEIVMVNTQTELLFRSGRDKLISRNIRSLIPDWKFQEPAEWDAIGKPAIIQSKDPGSDLHALRDDGSTFPVEIGFSPLQTEDGIVITSTIRDISERKKTEEQIRQLNVTLEQRVLERTEALMKSNDGTAAVRLYREPRSAGAFANCLDLRPASGQAIPGSTPGRRRPIHQVHRRKLRTYGASDSRPIGFFARGRQGHRLLRTPELRRSPG